MGAVIKKKKKCEFGHVHLIHRTIYTCVHDTARRFSSRVASHYVGRLYHTWETGSSFPFVGDHYAGCMKCGDCRRSSSRTMYTIIIQNQAENKSIKRNKILFSVKMTLKYPNEFMYVRTYPAILQTNAPKSFSVLKRNRSRTTVVISHVKLTGNLIILTL